MELKTELQKILGDIGRTLSEMPAAELAVFENQWQLIRSYLTQPEADRAGFIAILSEIVANSPTLVAHHFDKVLDNFSTRFSPRPAQDRLPDSTLGLPPVHNEVVDIGRLIEELTKKQKSAK